MTSFSWGKRASLRLGSLGEKPFLFCEAVKINKKEQGKVFSRKSEETLRFGKLIFDSKEPIQHLGIPIQTKEFKKKDWVE